MSITWGLAEQFRQILERRELAAYRCASAVQQVIHFWEAQDYDAAFTSLKRAHDDFTAAEAQLSEFRKTHKGELTRHGNSTAA